MKGIQSHILWLEARFAEVDGEKVTAMRPYFDTWHGLKTIPGIDKLGAAMLLAEIGINMDCFIRPEHLSSWAGLCPVHQISAGKKKVVIPFGLTAMSNLLQ